MPRYLTKNKDIIRLFKEYQNERGNQRKQARKLMKEFGAKDFALKYDYGLGGLKFEEDPDKTLWRRCPNKHLYGHWIPKKNSKEGKELYKKFKSVKKGVLHEELNKACGFKDWILVDGYRMFHGPGIEQMKDGSIVLDIDEKVVAHKDFEMPTNTKEITFEKYQALKGVTN